MSAGGGGGGAGWGVSNTLLLVVKAVHDHSPCWNQSSLGMLISLVGPGLEEKARELWLVGLCVCGKKEGM